MTKKQCNVIIPAGQEESELAEASVLADIQCWAGMSHDGLELLMLFSWLLGNLTGMPLHMHIFLIIADVKGSVWLIVVGCFHFKGQNIDDSQEILIILVDGELLFVSSDFLCLFSPF